MGSWGAIATVGAVCRVIGCVLDAAIFGWFLFGFSTIMRKERSLSSMLKWLSYFIYTCAIISIGGFTIMQLLAAIWLFQVQSTELKIFSTTINLITITATMVFYVARLYVSFHSSIYHVSIKSLIFYGIFVFSSVLLFLISEISFYVENWDTAGNICMILGLLSLGILMVFITFSFGNRLFSLVLSQRQTNFAVHIVRKVTNNSHKSHNKSSSVDSNNNNNNNNISKNKDKNDSSIKSGNVVVDSGNMSVDSNQKSMDYLPSGDGNMDMEKAKSSSVDGDGDGDTKNVDFSIKHQIKHQKSNQEVIDASLSERQQSLLRTIAKQSVLSIIAVLFIVLDCILLGIGYFTNDIFVLCTVHIILSLIYVVIPITIWFSFAFAHFQYFGICRKCHDCTQHWFGVLAIWKLTKDNSNNDNNPADTQRQLSHHMSDQNDMKPYTPSNDLESAQQSQHQSEMTEQS